jgi:chaperone required for assembly of F1-ATPase
MLGKSRFLHEVLLDLCSRRAANLQTIQQSCQVERWGENNSDTETQAIKKSIIDESDATGIPRVCDYKVLPMTDLC